MVCSPAITWLASERLEKSFTKVPDILASGATLQISSAIPPMNVRLICRDDTLNKLCREVLSEFPGSRWSFAPPNLPDPDLSIWDFHPDEELPEEFDKNPSKHLFFVQQKDLAKLQDRVKCPEAIVLLKPVTRATLSAFLGMAISVHADRAANATFLRADRDEILQCLIQANLKLQEYDQNRTNFLARALHDFRAPLTAINGYCVLLQSEALGPLQAEQKEALRRMRRSNDRLSRMASGMFELSVAGQVKRRFDLRRSDLRECIDQALDEVEPSAKGKNVSITVDLHPEGPLLFLEPDLIEQALANLLNNACKFTPKEGRIVIKGRPFFWERRSGDVPILAEDRRRHESLDPNSYRIDIANSGPRIPEELLGSIFEEYTSYSGPQDRSGGGLGLAICRMIIMQHEGRIWAENTAIGPQFSFVLPRHAEAGAAAKGTRTDTSTEEHVGATIADDAGN
jgi:signal transduction histidine kinase